MKRIALTFVFCVSLGLGCVWADIVDWSQLGPSSFVLTGPQLWTSVGGNTGQVGVAGGDGTFERLDQGAGWNGNFLPGSALIWNRGNGDFLFSFSNPVSDVGAAVQANLFGPFVANLYVYDGLFNLLGSTQMNGVSNSNGDGSAIFISLTGFAQSISYAQFNVVDSQGGVDFGMCTMSLHPGVRGPSGSGYPCGAIAPTPEPGSLPLLGSGVLGMLWIIRRKLA